ncbi:MAG: C39 family peptidase [Ruminococcus sp.]|nr:C39 family peptidase [Ruminococcus sp.]
MTKSRRKASNAFKILAVLIFAVLGFSAAGLSESALSSDCPCAPLAAEINIETENESQTASLGSLKSISQGGFSVLESTASVGSSENKDLLLYVSQTTYVYDKSLRINGSVSASSYYTGYYDDEYAGFYVINYMSSERLIKKSSVTVKKGAKVLQTSSIGQYGGEIAGYSACGPTAIAILVNSEKGESWDKDELIRYSQKHDLDDQGSLLGGGGMTAPKLLELVEGYSDGKYSAENVYDSTDDKIGGIISQLDSSHRVLAVVCYKNRTILRSGGRRHFIVICGYEAIGSTLYFYYADPYYGNGASGLKAISASLLEASMKNVDDEPRTMIVLNE